MKVLKRQQLPSLIEGLQPSTQHIYIICYYNRETLILKPTTLVREGGYFFLESSLWHFITQTRAIVDDMCEKFILRYQPH